MYKIALNRFLFLLNVKADVLHTAERNDMNLSEHKKKQNK